MNVITKRRPPRLNHKKSKAGCLRCKQRRVKCDEKHPVCGGCDRHEVECIYANALHSTEGTPEVPNVQRPELQQQPLPVQTPGRPIRSESLARTPSISDQGEPGGGRLLELRLMHNFLTRTIVTLPATDVPGLRDLWLHKAVPLALQHPALLNALLAVSSFHLAFQEPASARTNVSTGQAYLSEATRQHKDSIANLSALNAEAVFLTCVLMSVFTLRNVAAYALEQAGEDEDTQSEYADRQATLHQRMASINEIHATVSRAWNKVKDQPDSLLFTVQSNIPRLWDQRGLQIEIEEEPKLPDGLEEGLRHILDRAPKIGMALYRPNADPPPAPMVEELDDGNTKGLYETVIQRLLFLYRSIASGEHQSQSVGHLVCASSSLMPSQFDNLVQQQRPRALILMVFCFVAMHNCRDLWWVGDRGMRDAVKVAEELGCTWRPYLEWPLRYVGRWEDAPVEWQPRSRLWCYI